MPSAHPLVQMLKVSSEDVLPVGPSLSVGLASANLMALGGDVARLEAAGVRLAHFDVMDGCYVPMLTFGPPFIKAVTTTMLKDVHLMVRDPLASIGGYVDAGADLITIHPDACQHPHRVLQTLGTMASAGDAARPVARGAALNPGVPVEVLDPLMDDVELIVLVAINPGWGGQAFVPATLKRIEIVQKKVAASGRNVLLAVDGGITKQNVGQLAGRGVDIIVTGSAAFDGDVASNVSAMTRALRQ